MLGGIGRHKQVRGLQAAYIHGQSCCGEIVKNFWLKHERLLWLKLLHLKVIVAKLLTMPEMAASHSTQCGRGPQGNLYNAGQGCMSSFTMRKRTPSCLSRCGTGLHVILHNAVEDRKSIYTMRYRAACHLSQCGRGPCICISVKTKNVHHKVLQNEGQKFFVHKIETRS